MFYGEEAVFDHDEGGVDFYDGGDDEPAFNIEDELDKALDIELMSEVKAFERAGPSNKLDELLLGPEKVTHKGKEIYSLDQKFLINVNSFANRIMDEKSTVLSKDDVRIMLEIATTKLTGIKYKNHAAYVIGYILTSGGTRNIDTNKFNSIPMSLKYAKDETGVYFEDAIRYSRLWVNLKKLRS
jgi:hypothetical protein